LLIDYTVAVEDYTVAVESSSIHRKCHSSCPVSSPAISPQPVSNSLKWNVRLCHKRQQLPHGSCDRLREAPGVSTPPSHGLNSVVTLERAVTILKVDSHIQTDFFGEDVPLYLTNLNYTKHFKSTQLRFITKTYLPL